jgi:hypothetical protein
MRPDFDNVLDQCLAWLRDGAGIDDCLAAYPEYADELRPLLELVAQVGRVLTPAAPAAVRAAGEQRMLAALAQKRERQAGAWPFVRTLEQMMRALVPGRRAWGLAATLLAVLLFAASGWGFAASADSLPGDPLYPVKVAAQKARLALTHDPGTRQQLDEQFAAQQRRDVQSVLEDRRRVTVEFLGVLQKMESSVWVVGGLPITVQDATIIVGQPYPGTLVRVQGYLPGDGSLLASRLEVDLTATPWPTEVPPTDTPEPIGTAEPTETPRQADTAEPTDTPKPPATPEPEETPEQPEPTATTRMLAPTRTPEPTESPEAAETPEPAEDPEPGESPEREVTSEPAETPEPADEPEPDDGSEPDDVQNPDDEPEPGNPGELEGTAEPPDEPDDPDDADDTAVPDEPEESDDTPEPTEEPED